jgi:hypothetical protein
MDITSFIESVKNKSRSEIIKSATREIQTQGLETPGVRRKKGAELRRSLGLRSELEGLLFWLQHQQAPAGLSHSDFLRFRPLCESLVKSGELEDSALGAFDHPPAAEISSGPSGK